MNSKHRRLRVSSGTTTIIPFNLNQRIFISP